MPDKKEPAEDSRANYFQRDIDPDLQTKVQEYMDPSPKPIEDIAKMEETVKPEEPIELASAPLLPSDKLPNLDKSSKTAKDQISSPEPEIQAVAGESALASLTPENVEKIDDDLGLNDPQTSKAVEDIIAEESDAVIRAEDEKIGLTDVSPRKGFSKRVGAFLAGWWHHRKLRNATLMVFFIAIFAVLVAPSSRYYVLNSIGVRSSTSLVVVDDKTGLPLKNVQMSISGKSAKTDGEGNVSIEKIKLGQQQMVIEKPAFASIDRTVVIGWGSNPQGETRLTPTGLSYTFVLKDFLSSKPITKAEASNGQASARVSDKGEIVLTVPQTEQEQIEVSIQAEDYRTETLMVPINQKASQNVLMAPAHKHAFVSKRTGTFDLYKIDVDGKNEQKVLSGTGKERQDTMSLVPHPKKNIVAYVSTRDGQSNKDGFVLSTLNVIDLDKDEVSKVANSERIQIVDWVGNRLVYVKITEGASEANLQRHRLMSYNFEDQTNKELASTNYFNDVMIARGSIYYSPAIYKVNGSVGLYKVSPDGSSKKTIYDKEVWNLFRTSYDQVSVSVGQDWYDLTLSSDGFVKAASAPPVLKSRLYIDGPDSKRSLWIDERDGKGVMLSYDIQSKQEKTIQTEAGLKNPMYWTDESHVVYRINNGQETADYILSFNGGEPKKIRDVTNVAGVDRWYYY